MGNCCTAQDKTQKLDLKEERLDIDNRDTNLVAEYGSRGTTSGPDADKLETDFVAGLLRFHSHNEDVNVGHESITEIENFGTEG